MARHQWQELQAMNGGIEDCLDLSKTVTHENRGLLGEVPGRYARATRS